MRSINPLTILLILAFGVQAADGQPQIEQVALKTADKLEIHAQRIANGNDAALIYCHRLLSSKDSFDAFLGEHIFLMRAKYDLRFGKWLGNTSHWEPLAVSLLFDAGDARKKEVPLEFWAPRLEAGVEFSYASAIKIAILKSLGKERVTPYIYFGWYPNIFLLKS